jgi:hypothetical protein
MVPCAHLCELRHGLRETDLSTSHQDLARAMKE